MIEYKAREHNIKDRSKVIFIVGMCPGKQRFKDRNQEVFHGNKTGDLVESIVKDKSNLYLTNVFNFYVEAITDEIVQKGIESLKTDLGKYKPVKVICLGDFAHKKVKSLTKAKIVALPHPSYIIRFNKGKEDYTKRFKDAID